MWNLSPLCPVILNLTNQSSASLSLSSSFRVSIFNLIQVLLQYRPTCGPVLSPLGTSPKICFPKTLLPLTSFPSLESSGVTEQNPNSCHFTAIQGFCRLTLLKYSPTPLYFSNTLLCCFPTLVTHFCFNFLVFFLFFYGRTIKYTNLKCTDWLFCNMYIRY